MSNFGVHFNDWVTIGFASKNNNISILVNRKEAISLPSNGKINKFSGFVISFEGTGSIRALNLWNSKRIYLNRDYDNGVKSNENKDFNSG